uniref:NADH dehydrogenase subunit 2 n=1 Tax=Marsupiomonas sp. NIES 1824 TaxID=1562198 RepID=A0A6H0R081_9CHLO|nr:NADH dehydrogenase subunit 2 [Marsupiomonas sp. NIES 1824]
MPWMIPETFLSVRAMYLLFAEPSRNARRAQANPSKQRSLYLAIRASLRLLDLRDRACLTRVIRRTMRRGARWILLAHRPEQERKEGKVSFSFLVTSRTRASMFMLRTESLLSLYLRLELQRLCRYVLVRRENQRAVEARLKYLILGAFRSGLLLLGLGMVYARQGTLLVWPSLEERSPLLRLRLSCVTRALFFKAGRRPFHFWVPDVYQGRPTLARAYLRTVRKRGIVGLLLTLPIPALGLWRRARRSMILGVFGAIPQSHLKRLFRYSSIAQVGYVFLGLLGVGKTRVVRFLSIYLVTALHRFGIFLLPTPRTTFAHLHRSSSLAVKRQVTLTFFSLAGVPPLLGFVRKASVLQSARERGEMARVAVGLRASLVGAYYSLRVVQTLFAPLQELPCRVRLATKEVPSMLRGLLSSASLLLPRALLR